MKTNIKSTAYSNVFEENSTHSNGILSALIVIVLFTILSGLIGFYIGDSRLLKKLGNSTNNTSEFTYYSSNELNKIISTDAYDFNLYGQIAANLKEKYVDASKISDQALFDGSLKGMVDAVGDKATTYFTQKEYQEYLKSFSGEFEGIGVQLEYKDDYVIVMEVLPDSPAERENVQQGWVFEKVDGKDVTQSTIEEIVSKVRGTAGTKVKITFVDPVKREEHEKEITRAPVKVTSMRLIEVDKDTVIFEVSRFTEDRLETWLKLWDEKVNEIVAKGYKNVVLDLRGNGGGFLDAAIYAANDFLEPGKLIVTEKTRNSNNNDTKSTKTNPRFKGKNIVLLINGGTASASEILAGAIQYHNGYKVLGTKSYGKGTVQNTIPISDNRGALKITTEYWILPTGKHLDNENPIEPNIEVKQDQEAYKKGEDNVLQEALKQFSGK